MSRLQSIIVAIVIASIIGGALGSGGIAAFSAEQEYKSAARAHEQAEADLESATENESALKGGVDKAEAELATLQAVLAERGNFSAQLERVRQGAATAVGKVDTAQWLERVIALQDEVVTIETDPARVAELTAQVSAEADGIEKAVADYDAEQKRQAEARSSSRSGGGGGGSSSSEGGSPAAVGGGGGSAGDAVSRARSVLAGLGGSWVQVESYDGACGSKTAMACAHSDGVISIRPDAAGLGSGQFNWMIVHEYAHQVQFQNWTGITSHSKYHDLFGGDMELLANCMASARGYTYGGRNCSQQMVDEAGAVWGGGFR